MHCAVLPLVRPHVWHSAHATSAFVPTILPAGNVVGHPPSVTFGFHMQSLKPCYAIPQKSVSQLVGLHYESAVYEASCVPICWPPSHVGVPLRVSVMPNEL